MTIKCLFILIVACGCAGTFAATQNTSATIYDPADDPIPYKPGRFIHGAPYEIPSDPWKKEADKRIDTLRKANLNTGVVNKMGRRLANVPVHVELMRHDFFWGAVVNGDFLIGNHNDILESYFLKYFNSGGFENGLKPKQCTMDDCRGASVSHLSKSAESQLKWFQEHDIPVRGHALVWEGAGFLSSKMRQMYENPKWSDEEKGERMCEHYAQHLDHAVEKWDVMCWDVVNEPRVNHCINELLPDTDTLVDWFRKADRARKKYDRDFKLFYNENQIISYVRKDGSFAKHRDIYKSYIKDVLDAGVSLDGIGMQYRFRGYVEPEEVYRRLCDFEDLGLPYQATEFEIKSPARGGKPFSNSQKKKITAEVLTQFFSHPNATGLWHWTFMERRRGGSPHALFSFDGEPRPEAEQWIKMMEEDFNTDETVQTEKNGIATVRGFKGIYKVTVGKGLKTKTSIIEVKEDTNLKIVY